MRISGSKAGNKRGDADASPHKTLLLDCFNVLQACKTFFGLHFYFERHFFRPSEEFCSLLADNNTALKWNLKRSLLAIVRVCKKNRNLFQSCWTTYKLCLYFRTCNLPNIYKCLTAQRARIPNFWEETLLRFHYTKCEKLVFKLMARASEQNEFLIALYSIKLNNIVFSENTTS